MTKHTLGWLWSRYLEARDALNGPTISGAERSLAERQIKSLRDRLVVNYSPLVRYVTGRVSGRMTYPLDEEDILSWGVQGLLSAIETYDPARQTKFESYAISKIRWSILDALRKADPLSRRLRVREREVEKVRGELAQRFGRSPTEEEVARELNVGISEHRTFLERCSLAYVASLEARAELDGSPYVELHELVGDRTATDPASAAEVAEIRGRLVEALGALSERERLVVTLYFYEGLTLREIGGALSRTEGRISQILRAALCKLRERLSESHRPTAS